MVVQIDADKFWNNYGNRLEFIQSALDQGASLQQISDAVDKIYRDYANRDYANRDVNVYPLLDLNGDGMLALIVDQYLFLYAIGCDYGCGKRKSVETIREANGRAIIGKRSGG